MTLWPRLHVCLSSTGSIAIVQSGHNTHSALVVPGQSTTLTDVLLLQNRNQLLLSHLPSLDLIINRAAGIHISETVEYVAVELRETQMEIKRVWDKKENKGAADYFGANLAHLLNLVQVIDAKDPPP